MWPSPRFFRVWNVSKGTIESAYAATLPGANEPVMMKSAANKAHHSKPSESTAQTKEPYVPTPPSPS